MIFIIWLVSFFVCIAPLLGWKDPNWEVRLRDKKCIVSQDIYYQIFATASSFYLPLMVILVLYWRIFQTARKRIRRRQVLSKVNEEGGKNPAAGGIAGGLAAASGTGTFLFCVFLLYFLSCTLLKSITNPQNILVCLQTL